MQENPGAQSEFELHPTAQAALTQACGEQSVVAPATHLPVPLQVEVPTRIPVLPGLQAGAAQIVPDAYEGQWPAPSQTPVVPQLALPMSVQRPLGSGPAGSGEQVPSLPVTLQALQAVQAALEQQTPSVHMPLRQLALLAQAAPSGSRLVQMPPWQVVPVTQSALVAQAVRHAVGPHTKLPGQAVDDAAQVPLPLQALTTLLDPEQVVVAQLLPAAVFRQAPAPLQVPSKPQGGLAGHS